MGKVGNMVATLVKICSLGLDKFGGHWKEAMGVTQG